MKKLTKKQKLQKAQNEHRKFCHLWSLNINTRNRVIIKQRIGTPFPDLTTVEEYKTSDNISGIGRKKWSPGETYTKRSKTV